MLGFVDSLELGPVSELVGLFGLEAPVGELGLAVPLMLLFVLLSSDELVEALLFAFCEPPCTPSAESVWLSRLAVRWIPCFCWNWRNAFLVFGPSWPSTGPALRPLSFNACCTWRIKSASFEDVPAFDPVLAAALLL